MKLPLFSYRIVCYFLLALCFFISTKTQAQTTIAKLKYEQAEEAFSKADYLSTVAKLEEAEKLLGSINPKILYLRIMSQEKLLESDSSMVAPLRKNCQFYLKTYEGIENVEEKYKEVYLVSEKLLQYEKNPDYEAGSQAFRNKDYSIAISYFKKATGSGFARAMTYMGIMNLYGYGIDVNHLEARKWFRLSAEKGNGFGQYWLGEAYYFGYGGEKNIQEALQLYAQAAAKNLTPAFVGLGNIYYFELKDYKKAYEWYRKAADRNDGYSQHNVAGYFLQGLIVPKDEAAALTWYKKALNNGYDGAMNGIGLIYQNGYGVPKDYKQAFEWYTKGADKGVYKCMLGLSKLYEDGLGVNKDKKMAKEWKTKADAVKNKQEQTQ